MNSGSYEWIRISARTLVDDDEIRPIALDVRFSSAEVERLSRTLAYETIDGHDVVFGRGDDGVLRAFVSADTWDAR